MTLEAKVHVSFAGRYQLLVKDAEGNIKHDTGWFDNLITNQGLDWIGGGVPNYNVSSNQPLICTHCGVGTGSTAPAITDTLLTSFLAMYPPTSSGNVEGVSSATYIPGPPAYWSNILSYNFAVGAVIGNIAEVGTGNTASADTQPQLFSHALIVNSGGTPTTISLTSTDALTVNYDLRMYLDLTDNTYTMNISGTTYSGTYRRAFITTAPFYNRMAVDGATGGQLFSSVYNGSIGPLTNGPSGASDGNNSFTYSIAAYTLGSYYLTVTTIIPTGAGNLSGGISAMTTYCNHGQYQFSISPVIPKTAVDTLTINWNVSWARYP